MLGGSSASMVGSVMAGSGAVLCGSVSAARGRKVLGLAGEDSHDAEEQVGGETQGHGHVGGDDGRDGVLDVGGEHHGLAGPSW
ncbi:Rad21 Rec8 N domain containing protein [Gracilaria domingensis]|nr:Rad21 Rec8 N domain containing protein [Gracilaria domingensis]